MTIQTGDLATWHTVSEGPVKVRVLWAPPVAQYGVGIDECVPVRVTETTQRYRAGERVRVTPHLLTLRQRLPEVR